MGGSGMPVMKLRRQSLTRFRFAQNCGLKQQFLDISRQIGPSLEYCTAKQVFRSSHHYVSYTWSKSNDGWQSSSAADCRKPLGTFVDSI